MKKYLLFYSICFVLVLNPLSIIQACQHYNEIVFINKTSSVLQSPKVDHSKAIQFIENFYSNCVFKRIDYKPILEKLCTTKLLKELKDNYDYDGEGYAIWNFRTGAQDGPNDVSKVTSITVLGNGIYKVNFIDMGIKGNRTLKIVTLNGILKFDAIE